MKKIAFLFGGRSEEHEVSLSSAACLLPRLHSTHREIYPIFIGKDGSLYHLSSPSSLQEKGVDRAALHPITLSYSGASLCFKDEDGRAFFPTLFFSALHGRFGEDGAWQGLFALSGTPFIGCDVLSSAVCMNKAVTKELLEGAHIPTARFFSVRDAGDSTLLSVEKLFSYPVFVKPAASGSSFGASRADSRDALKTAILDALRYGEEVLVEEYIDGREISVAVLEKDGVLTVSPPGEILSDGVFDYKQKYGGRDTLLCPARLSDDQSKTLIDLSRKIFRRLRCRHLARIDFFISRDGRILFNEINTIPGFTSHSLYTRLLALAHGDLLSLLDEVGK